MNIVFLTPVKRKITGNTILEEPLGGTHSSLINLATKLSKTHNIKVFSNCYGEEGIYNNVEYKQINNIVRYSKENDIDVLICVASESTLKAKIKAKKTILWLHNDYSPYYNNELSDIASEISGYMCVYSDKIVVVSEWLKNKIIETFNVPENHIVVIPNGIDTSFFDSKNLEDKNKNKLIYTSAPDRGLDLLIDFFDDLKEKIPNIEVHAFSSFESWGKTEILFKELENDIFEKANSKEGFFIHKPIPINQLKNELSNSFLYVYPNHSSPSTYFEAETFCISAIEAQSSGLPVISSYRGAIPEVIQNNISGELINLDPYSNEYKNLFINKIIDFYNNEEKYNLFSKKSIENAKRFDLDIVSNLWENFFLNLFSENSTKLLEPSLKASYKTPKVSIVMPVYNRENNLYYCLSALTKQTFRDFEVIITDDGSTDNTKGVADSFRDRLNIRYTYAGENKGFRAARARNIGLQKVRGELVIFLDSDIVTPSNYIEEHIKAHKKYDEILVNSFVYRMKNYKDDDLGIDPKEFVIKHRDNLNDDIKYEFHVFDKEEPIEEGYYLDSNSLSIKTKHIMGEGFDDSFVGWGHEDTELGYRYISKNFKFLFIKNNCESYHIHHYVSHLKDEETAVNWKRLRTKYNITRYYDPKPSIIIECPVRLNGLDCEKANTLTDIVSARFEIKRGDKITGFFPLFEFDITNWIK